MNPFLFPIRKPMTTLTILAGLASGGVVARRTMGYDIMPAMNTSRVQAFLRGLMPGEEPKKQVHHEEHKIVVTSPEEKDVVITQEYVCQIHSQRHIEIRALEKGYLEDISVKEGQSVKKGDSMFKIVPILYQANLEAELAEAELARLEFNNTKRLFERNVVSQNEVALLQAKLAKAQAKAKLAGAELGFTNVKAPFDGIVDRLQQQLGSLVQDGDILTTLSDNSVMWVYFNVPEARYLEYMGDHDKDKADLKVELELADGNKFPQIGSIGAIEANFDNKTGNIPFRADFPNPDGLLRHGQTGKVLIPHVLQHSVVIPQRAAFETLDKKYVYVVDKDNLVHQREIVVQHELDDVYVLKKGVGVNEKIVLEGLRQVHEGEKVAYEFHSPKLVMAQLKNKAE